MKRMISFLSLAVLVAACGAINVPPARAQTQDPFSIIGKIGGQVGDMVNTDATKTKELATLGGDTAGAKCADFFMTAIWGDQQVLSFQCPALPGGNMCRAEKLMLLQNSKNSAQTQFSKQCGEWSANMMIGIGKNAPIGGQLLR